MVSISSCTDALACARHKRLVLKSLASTISDVFVCVHIFIHSSPNPQNVLNGFSELDPILFLIQSYSPIRSNGENSRDIFITAVK